MKYLFFCCCLLSVFFLSSCKQRGNISEATNTPLYAPIFARGFSIFEQGKNRILSVKKSWQMEDSEDYNYVIYPREDSILYRGKSGYIPWPIEKAVCLSTTHIAYLAALDREESISGVSGARYISHPKIREAIASEKVIDVGYEAALNYETLLSLRPDVIFVYGIAGSSNAFLEPLIRLGLQVVYISDYLETHPLGKAEYLVAFAAFFEPYVMEKAAIQFQSICDQYILLKESVQYGQKVKVILNAPYKDVWYIPGRNNYLTQLLYDAGALALGSRPGLKESHIVSFEQAYLYAMEADYWLHPNAYRSLNSLRECDSRFASIPAFLAGRVYNNTRRNTPQGGSDFWETGVTEPHIMLADLIHIFHPDLLPDHSLEYYEVLGR